MIVLDTHAWLWWVASPSKLSRAAARSIRSASSLGVSAISCWEVGMLATKGRLRLDRDPLVWVQEALQLPRVTLLPLTPEIAVASTRLPGGLHGDPADRILAATALHLGAPLVTSDRQLRGYAALRTVW